MEDQEGDHLVGADAEEPADGLEHGGPAPGVLEDEAPAAALVQVQPCGGQAHVQDQAVQVARRIVEHGDKLLTLTAGVRGPDGYDLERELVQERISSESEAPKLLLKHTMWLAF